MSYTADNKLGAIALLAISAGACVGVALSLSAPATTSLYAPTAVRTVSTPSVAVNMQRGQMGAYASPAQVQMVEEQYYEEPVQAAPVKAAPHMTIKPRSMGMMFMGIGGILAAAAALIRGRSEKPAMATMAVTGMDYTSVPNTGIFTEAYPTAVASNQSRTGPVYTAPGLLSVVADGEDQVDPKAAKKAAAEAAAAEKKAAAEAAAAAKTKAAAEAKEARDEEKRKAYVAAQIAQAKADAAKARAALAKGETATFSSSGSKSTPVGDLLDNDKRPSFLGNQYKDAKESPAVPSSKLVSKPGQTTQAERAAKKAEAEEIAKALKAEYAALKALK